METPTDSRSIRQPFRGKSLHVTGLVISTVGLAGVVTMFCLLLTGLVQVHWEGSENVFTSAILLCLWAAFGFVISLIALCFRPNRLAIVTFTVSIVAVGASLCMFALVALLSMGANPV